MARGRGGEKTTGRPKDKPTAQRERQIVNVLVCGATGFIGSAICAQLEREGHRVIRASRSRPQPGAGAAVEAHAPSDGPKTHGCWIECDFSKGESAAQWGSRLRELNGRLAGFCEPKSGAGCIGQSSGRLDAVVNAAGIFSERDGQTFSAIHAKGPLALFEACAATGVRRILLVSALGCADGPGACLESKRRAEIGLGELQIESQIIRPSLTQGSGGESSRLFLAWASAPVALLPGGGRQPVRPVDVEDLADLAVRMLDPKIPAGQTIDAVGAEQMSLRSMLGALRREMGFAPALAISVPEAAMGPLSAIWGLAMRAAGRSGRGLGLWSRDSWAMLSASKAASEKEMADILGRQPKAIGFGSQAAAERARQEALAAWRAPLLRISLAMVWLWTAWVSAFVWPQGQSLALLGALGIKGGWAFAALYGASALDFLFGCATLARPGRRLWLAQMGLIAGYSAAIAIALPEYLWHPFGPLSKNIPILAILWILLSEEKKP